MKHGGAFATGACMLDMDATEGVGIDFCTEMHFMGKN